MSSALSQDERRKHQRFEVKNLAIAIPHKPASQVGKIVNISKGGLAVRYLDQNNWLGRADSIGVLVNSNFFMSRIPVRPICDFKVESQLSFSIINERQCCLQFDSLNSEQELLLGEFITKFTADNS